MELPERKAGLVVFANPVGVLGIVACAVTLTTAFVVLRAAPGRRQNRLLALAAASEGITIGAWWGANLLIESEAVVRVLVAAAGPITITWQIFYIWLVVHTLDTPITRPFKGPWGQRGLLALAVGLPAAWVLLPGVFFPRIDPLPNPPGGWYIALSPAQQIAVQIVSVAFVLTLVAAVWAYRLERDGPGRRRAKAFAIAFGFRDALFVVWGMVVVPAMERGPSPELLLVYFAGPPVAVLTTQALVAYGILQAQLFDVDLKIKRGISHTTVAAVFVAIYVAASETAQALLTPELGPVLGLVAAGLLVLAIVPLQRAAERVAGAVMPNVRESPEYVTEKKLEVYRQALTDAYAHGVPLSRQDETMLARLRDALGLTDRDHAVLDFSVRAARGISPAARPEPAHHLQGEELLGKYRVERLLGEGSFARSYLAVDTVLGRRVVIKAVRPDRSGVSAVLDEARAMARVRHPNVVTIFDVETTGGRAFIVMEHADGGSLKDRLAKGPLPREEFRPVALGLLAGLEAVHDAGMAHRDVKPANVLLTARGEAKLADFGVAHIPGFETTVGPGLGAAGGAVGTVRYMSPEQAKGRRVTARSDLYSAAVTLFEALTGEAYLAPLPGESAVELQMRAARADGYDRRCGDARLDAWFARALAPAPEDRFASAREALGALEAALAP